MLLARRPPHATSFSEVDVKCSSYDDNWRQVRGFSLGSVHSTPRMKLFMESTMLLVVPVGSFLYNSRSVLRTLQSQPVVTLGQESRASEAG